MASRKKNPALYRTRKAAVLDAIARIERDPAGTFYKQAFIVGGDRRWGMVTCQPSEFFIGPIRADNAASYRRWYCS
jgi:hypothetical protein